MVHPRKGKSRLSEWNERDSPTSTQVRSVEPELTDEGAGARNANVGEADMEVDCEQRPPPFENDYNLYWPVDDETRVAQIVLFISMFSSLFFSLSKASSDVLLRLLKCLVGTVLNRDVTDNEASQIMTNVPIDSRTVRSRFNISGGLTVYAVCPKCHCTYKPDRCPDTNELIYQETCNNIVMSTGLRCNERLLSEDKKTPMKKFEYTSVRDFIGGLVSRESIERAIDDSCDRLRLFANGNAEMRGPFDAEFLRHLKGPRSGQLFIERGNELRLAFSLNVNFFNKEGVRSGAANVSCGIISLACLNLPEDIRYKDENIFLAGIILGPKEPPLADINYYLAPLINDFVTLWNTGRTLGEVDTIYELRNTETLREQAIAWRHASTKQEREAIQSKYIDPMHCLLLGLVQNHFTTIFPLTIKVARESPPLLLPYRFDFKQVSPSAKKVYIVGKEYAIKANEIQDVVDIHGLLLQPLDVNDPGAEWMRLLGPAFSDEVVSPSVPEQVPASSF
ncbi:hypothetical protein A7U60_g1253 [Sanghuangporus baumii]|uniref:Uncharacterized protein n=1 Tax=Sanghuangporus baumii TaxID=108892 RepID=A0A9Q5I498_SANBA|nr:hypothetical protein A7U60_g1253 [Sanghuangporus baumii]